MQYILILNWTINMFGTYVHVYFLKILIFASTKSVCMILIYYTCIINLRWYDTLEILLYEKYYTVNGEKKVHKDEKKCKQVNAITLSSGIYVQQNVNIWKKWALNVLNQMITEHHYCLSEIILICHTSMSE